MEYNSSYNDIIMSNNSSYNDIIMRNNSSDNDLIMSNNPSITKEVEKSSINTGEKVWELPLWDDYSKDIKSKILFSLAKQTVKSFIVSSI